MLTACFDAAVAALRGGRPEEALGPLEAVLAAAPPPALEARAHGLHGQALLGCGRVEEARAAVQRAMRLARARGDASGLEALRALNGQVYAELARRDEQRRLAEAEAAELAAPLPELLAQAQTEEERVMVLVRKASALPPAEGLPLAEEAAAAAGPTLSVRARVLSLLALARCDPQRAPGALERAMALADEADEAQLVAAIVAAGRAAGVDLGVRVF